MHNHHKATIETPEAPGGEFYLRVYLAGEQIEHAPFTSRRDAIEFIQHAYPLADIETR